MLSWVDLIIQVTLILVLLVSAISKILHFQSFRLSLEQGALNRWSTVLSIGVPVAEMLLAVTLLLAQDSILGLSLLLILFIAFTLYIFLEYRKGSKVPCNCFGSAIQSPPSPKLIGRNLAFISLCVVSIFISMSIDIPSVLNRLFQKTSTPSIVFFILPFLGIFVYWSIEESLKHNDNSSRADTQSHPPDPGDSIPTIYAKRLPDATTVSIDISKREDSVAIIFVSSYCNSCINLYSRIAPFESRIIVIFLGSTIEDLSEITSESQRIETYYSDDFEIGNRLGVEKVPTAYVVSPTGVLLYPPISGPESILSQLTQIE